MAFDPASLENIASKVAPYLAIETSNQVLLYQPRLQVTNQIAMSRLKLISPFSDPIDINIWVATKG